jgi:biotin operon repressor
MVVDRYFPVLTGAEITILIVIIRQTHGWINKRTGKRKTRDWISHSQFMKKTGLSRRAISKIIQSLESKGLITTTDQYGNPIENRRGQWRIYYAPNLFNTKQPDTKGVRNKRTNTVMQIGEVLRPARYHYV